jgi:hypothetical protein
VSSNSKVMASPLLSGLDYQPRNSSSGKAWAHGEYPIFVGSACGLDVSAPA